jgi:3-oxoacyl-[acyl-carrier protein] reductase
MTDASARHGGGCALVTGASRGIGAAIAQRLAATGWPCAVNYARDEAGARTLAGGIVEAGGEALPIRADVGDAHEVDRMFAALEERYGRVLVLVNNAGVRMDGLSMQLAEEQWTSVLATNLGGAFHTLRRALLPMMRARWGRIVNVSSAAGLRASPGQANYAASKAGLIGLSRSAAVEVARRGITINTVAPGFVETQLTADVDRAILGHIPARRAGTAQEVAACVAFLASEEASYVTGATLAVDGGLTA